MRSLASVEDDFEYASQLQDDEDRKIREQEKKDFELAMKLSQEEEIPFGPFKFDAKEAISAFSHVSDIKDFLKDSDDENENDKPTQIMDSSKPSTSNFQSVIEDKSGDMSSEVELGLPGPSSKKNPWSDDSEDEFDAMIKPLKSPIKHHNISWSSEEDKPKTPPKAKGNVQLYTKWRFYFLKLIFPYRETKQCKKEENYKKEGRRKCGS